MSVQPSDLVVNDPDPTAHIRDLDAVSSREIRHLVRGLLSGHLGVLVDDAVLVADELVSNAQRHGRPPRTCRLVVIKGSRRLRIEVDDTAPEQPEIRTPDATGGRGLVLVDRLATAWGVRRHAHHKTVWAELALDRPAGGGRAPHLAAAGNWPSAN